MAGVHRTLSEQGVGLGNKKNPTTAVFAPVSLAALYQAVRHSPFRRGKRTRCKPSPTSTLSELGLPSSSAQLTRTSTSSLPESVGAAKTLSVGYTGANTAFLNTQSVAAAGDFIGARPVVNIRSKDITCTLGSADWTTAVMVGVDHFGTRRLNHAPASLCVHPGSRWCCHNCRIADAGWCRFAVSSGTYGANGFPSELAWTIYGDLGQQPVCRQLTINYLSAQGKYI